MSGWSEPAISYGFENLFRRDGQPTGVKYIRQPFKGKRVPVRFFLMTERPPRPKPEA